MDDESYKKHLEVVQHGFRAQFERGDKLALLDCIRWCDANALPLPHWALTVLSKAAGKYLLGVSATLHDALFGARKDTGRHANLATGRRESHHLLFDIVTALKQAGFKGDRLYARARELLQQLYLTPDRKLVFRDTTPRNILKKDTIKKRFEKMQNDGARPSGFVHLIPLMVDLGVPPRRGKK